MPAKSDAQRRLFAIAEHKPDELFAKNKKILGSMSREDMHDFAATKGLKSKPTTPAQSNNNFKKTLVKKPVMKGY